MPPSSPDSRLDLRRDTWIALAILAATGLAFANSLGGEFVYDDRKQIVGNYLIQEPGRLWQALTSDVWAFKGERPESWSNYWRPTFVLWLAAQYRAFGLDSTLPWHLANVLLHALVSLLAYVFLRQLSVSRRSAVIVVLLFAVHPVHVESVAWISGSPDLLLAASLLAALSLVLHAERLPGQLWARGLALVLYAVAVLAKEIGVVGPVLVAVVIFFADPGKLVEIRRRLHRALLVATPFAVVAAAYLVTRQAILGRFEIETPWQVGPLELLATAPSILVFYLGQVVFPWRLGPSYPLRTVTPETLGPWNFWFPMAATLVVGWLFWRFCRFRPRALVGLAVFLLPLLPAFNINAFIEEQLVHDRYLYLPLLGLLLMVVPPLVEEVGSRGKRTASVATAVLILSGALLTFQTVRYNRAWGSELALWERGIRSDPTSSFNYAQYGNVLLEAGRHEEAASALDRSLSIAPVTGALLDRAHLARLEGRLTDAESDLQRVLDDQPDNLIALQRLALVHQHQGRPNDAAAVLRAGRDRLPHRRCAFSSDLAVLHYLSGDKTGAREILESVRDQVGREPSPACHLVLFRLGSLYLEQGRLSEARSAFERYLTVSERATDPDNIRQRQSAQRHLERLVD